MRNARTVADQIVAHFDRDAGNAARLGVAVERRVEQAARIRLVIARHDAARFE